MSKERELLKTILAYMCAEYLVMTEFEMIAQIEDTVKEIQELLAQPEQTEQEPVAWIDDGCNGLIKRPLSFFRSTRAEQVAFEDGIIFAKILYGIGVDDE
jgi:Mg2+ and Co2+ transporter CorA